MIAWVKETTRRVRTQVLVALLLSLPVGIAGSYIANQIGRASARLTVTHADSSLAGQTVADLFIRNVGDLELSALNATIRFAAPVTFSIEPSRFRPYSQVNGQIFTISAPLTEHLKPNEDVRVRFSWYGPNAIEDLDSLPHSIESRIEISQAVTAEWASGSLLSILFTPRGLLGLGGAAIVIILVAFGFVVRKARRPTGRGTPGAGSHDLSAAAPLQERKP